MGESMGERMGAWDSCEQRVSWSMSTSKGEHGSRGQETIAGPTGLHEKALRACRQSRGAGKMHAVESSDQ